MGLKFVPQHIKGNFGILNFSNVKLPRRNHCLILGTVVLL